MPLSMLFYKNIYKSLLSVIFVCIEMTILDESYVAMTISNSDEQKYHININEAKHDQDQ